MPGREITRESSMNPLSDVHAKIKGTSFRAVKAMSEWRRPPSDLQRQTRRKRTSTSKNGFVNSKEGIFR